MKREGNKLKTVILLEKKNLKSFPNMDIIFEIDLSFVKNFY